MGKNSARKHTQCLDEIARLKAKRRRDVIMCALVLVAILFFLWIKQILVMQGIIDQGSIIVAALTMIATFGLAIVGGTASIDFTRSGKRIQLLCQQGGISQEEAKTIR